jgi:hypothetical protein
VFRGGTLLGAARDQRSVFRRDFNPGEPEQFDAKWLTGWAAGENLRKKTGDAFPVDRLAKNAKWSATPWPEGKGRQRIAAMVLGGDRLIVAGTDGDLAVLSTDDGRVLGRAEAPAFIWDGMAAASRRLLVSTRTGRIVCFH